MDGQAPNSKSSTERDQRCNREMKALIQGFLDQQLVYFIVSGLQKKSGLIRKN